MERFFKFCENRLYCWKFLILYMALTLFEAPDWCFVLFWCVVGCVVGFYAITTFIAAIFAAYFTVYDAKHKEFEEEGLDQEEFKNEE